MAKLDELPSVGEAIKKLRTTRGLSMRRLADHAKVNVSTLSRWESQKQLPRVPELEAVLQALGASPAQRRTLLQKMDASRSVLALRRSCDDAELPSFHGPRSSRADLLWAMRQRRGWTQAEAARAAGVAQSQLARWESGDTWADPARLHALCWGLNASPDEVRIITVGSAEAFAGNPLWTASQTWDEFAWGCYLNRLLLYRPSLAVLDLRCITVEQILLNRIHQNRARYEFAPVYLAITYAIHARHHTWYKNWKQAAYWAERGIHVAGRQGNRLRAAPPQQNNPEMRPSFWFGSVIALAESISHTQRPSSLNQAARLLYKWLPALPHDDPHHAWGRMEYADILVALGRADEAVALGKAASEKAERISVDEASARWQQFARILLTAAKPRQALKAVERSQQLNALGMGSLDSVPSPRLMLLEAECLTALGDIKSAEERVRWSEQIINENKIWYLQDKLHHAVSQIEKAR